MRNLYTFITFFTIALYLVVAIMVLRVWRQGKAQRRFFFLLVSSAAWLTTTFFETFIRSSFRAYEILTYMDFILASIVSYCFLIFAIHFPRNNDKLTFLKEIAIFIPIIILSLLTVLNKFFVVNGYNNLKYNKILYIIYIVTLITYFLILGAGILIKKYIKSKGLPKLQLKYLLLGYVISITFALYSSIHNALIYPLPDELFIFLVNVIVLFALSSSYAILKYRLMDIRVVLRKGFVHGVSLVILLALYTYLTLFFQDYFELNRNFTTLIAVFVIALTLYPLRKWLFRTIDALFFEPEKEKETIQKFSSEISKGLGLEDLFKKAQEALAQGLNVEEVKIFILDRNQGKFTAEYPNNFNEFLSEEDELIKYLKEKKEIVVKEEIPYLVQGSESREQEQFQDIEKELKNKNAEVVIPFGEEDIFGLIFLGPKKSQEAFTVQDIRFLNNFARQFTLYLGNALLYKQAVERVTRNV